MDLGKNEGLIIEGRLRYNVCKLCIPRPNQFRSLIQLAGMAVQLVSCGFTYPVNRECRVNIGYWRVSASAIALLMTLSLLVDTSHLTEPWKMRRFILVAPEVVRMKTTWTAANLFSDNKRLPRMH